MGIQVNGNFVHWNYFIAIEQDLAKVSRFIEFSEANFDTYSIELAHLLLAASSEVDVVLKALCNIKNPGKSHQNINDYKETIGAELPELIDEKVFIHRYGLELEPWTNWNGENNPRWWRSYNKVKHQRDTHFKEASLNVLLQTEMENWSSHDSIKTEAKNNEKTAQKLHPERESVHLEKAPG